MPGRYLCHAESNGSNPGNGFVRLALVHQQSIMSEALLRLRAELTGLEAAQT
ncbi:putative Aat-like aminotransferase [Pseudomonas amygdali pv. tabaci]|nr:putative Aat-like aminotransferase [Pseudomonas amygdali pv. tabaci]